MNADAKPQVNRRSLHVFRTLALMELRFQLARPLLFVLIVLLLVISWGLSSGRVTISSGDSTVGGQARAWITSEFAIGMMFPLVTFLLYSFFLAIAAGMAILRDDELQVGPLLHSTRLSPGAYVWGKFLAVVVAFLGVLCIHLLATIFFNQVLPNAQADLIRGPFALSNYLRPALILALPFLVFLAGASLAVGELTRRPILVFVIPVAFYLITIFFLWDWSPSWLNPQINRLLMAVEPSGFRWINETWLKVDRGVAFYNHQPIVYDLPFVLSRLIYCALGLLGVGVAHRHFAATLRGSKSATTDQRLFWQGRPRPGRPRPGRPRPGRPRPDVVPPAEPQAATRALASLGMTMQAPGFWSTMVHIARAETQNLRGQPGLYLFVPLILLETIGNAFFQVGPLDTPLLLTPGTAAVGAMDTLTLLVVLLILFYTVESVSREWQTGLAPVLYATPAPTGAILLGKAVANSILGVSILLAAYLGAAVVMLIQGKVLPAVGPFLLVWGLLLLPTFLVWSALVSALLALTRNRFTTYGLGLGALAVSGWLQNRNWMNWVSNWDLWSAVTWTDFGGLDPNIRALLLNRLFWLAVMAVLVVLTVRVFPRREFDSARTVDRLRPRSLGKAAAQALPLLLPALVLGVVLWWQVNQGYQGKAVERREREYLGRNLLTWGQAELPQLTDVDLDLTLEPDDRSFAVKGSYELINRSNHPMHRIPLSVGDHFEDLAWTLDGAPVKPENWARVHVFLLQSPLQPGAKVRIGFAHHGRFPAGISKNGGGMREFILPSGVVLTSFRSSFVPVVGMEFGRGMDPEHPLEPRSYEEGFFAGVTRPAIGSGTRFGVRTKISGPARFAYHGVGVRESEEVVDGRRTVVWQSDQPVNFFNVVAGEWETWQGDGVSLSYHPRHRYNLEEIQEALTAARKYYSAWFYPYPWRELKVSEFPGLVSYAQGFPTNITFSESIGFLTRSTPETRLTFLVTAHEAAHQWWGNILMPGEGPGGEILAEGMAHFSTILLMEQVKGEAARIEFCRRIEERYGDNRRVDGERPLVWTDGSKQSDTTVIYDKGGWVVWMLLNLMGREAALAGIHDFIARYQQNEDHPVLQDFLAVLREHATDVAAFDAFATAWFYQVVVPEYRFEAAKVEPRGSGFVVEATVKNLGTGRPAVEVAAVRGVRFPAPSDVVGEPWQVCRTTISPDSGESQPVTLECPFKPERLEIDPDAKVLMLQRENAVHAFR